MPAEALNLVVSFDNISNNNIHEINKLVSEVGFHPAGEKMTDGEFTSFLNYQPFEYTDKNIQLIETCVDKISSEFPNAEVNYDISRTNNNDAITQQQCEITIRNESEIKMPSNGTGDSDESERRASDNNTNDFEDINWRDTESRGSSITNDNSNGDDQHQIFQHNSINVRINYNLDTNSQVLVFDSIEDESESGMLGFQQGERLEFQVEKYELHCTCGKAVNMTSEEEAIRHLNNKPTTERAESADDADQQDSDKASDTADNCPECGGDDIVYDDSRKESVCSDCGLVIESSTKITKESDSDIEWHNKKAYGSSSTNSDSSTQQQEADGPRGPPDNCIDCDSQNIESTPDESEQFICSDCGLVMAKRNTERKSEYVRARWSEQTDTAIVGIIKEPHRRHHEYYRIDNPREFFKNCSGEIQKIKQSDLEPFETLDLPHIDWIYSE
jgi:Zn finger protein HypA/HybF involved in hydrogenase expression